MAYMDVAADQPNGNTVVLLHGKNFSGIGCCYRLVKGDEFVVLAVSSAFDGVKIMLARLQDNLRAFNLREKLLYRLSLSAGIVQVDANMTASIEDVIKEADQAMYEHKRSKKRHQRLGHSGNREFA